jgi:hypothetical protein
MWSLAGGRISNYRPFELGGIPAISQAVPWRSGGAAAGAAPILDFPEHFADVFRGGARHDVVADGGGSVMGRVG